MICESSQSSYYFKKKINKLFINYQKFGIQSTFYWVGGDVTWSI